MTVKEWMEIEKEKEKYAQLAIKELQDKYFEIIEILLQALHETGHEINLDPINED